MLCLTSRLRTLKSVWAIQCLSAFFPEIRECAEASLGSILCDRCLVDVQLVSKLRVQTNHVALGSVRHCHSKTGEAR